MRAPHQSVPSPVATIHPSPHVNVVDYKLPVAIYLSYVRLNGHASEQAPGVGDREAWPAAAHGVTKSRT